jgi:hypothetical protein
MSDSMDKEKAAAKELLVKAKIYRFLAGMFAVVGLIIFAIVFTSKFDGKIINALQNPYIVIAMVMPFLPAVVLSFMAAKADKKLNQLYVKIKGVGNASS